jgi:hypothetical protein
MPGVVDRLGSAHLETSDSKSHVGAEDELGGDGGATQVPQLPDGASVAQGPTDGNSGTTKAVTAYLDKGRVLKVNGTTSAPLDTMPVVAVPTGQRPVTSR